MVNPGPELLIGLGSVEREMRSTRVPGMFSGEHLCVLWAGRRPWLGLCLNGMHLAASLFVGGVFYVLVSDIF